MSSSKREWKEIAGFYHDLCQQHNDEAIRAKEALGRVWITIEAAVHDPGLANTLRMAVMGDLLPGMIINYTDSEVDAEPAEGEES